MNDFVLMRKNLFRKWGRTTLLIVTITVGFAIFAAMVSFSIASTNFNTLPTRMVTLSKINFTESLPMAHYDRIKSMEGVKVATHLNWFGGYFREPVNFLAVFAVDPETYFEVYSEDLQIPAEQREAFFKDRTAMLAAAPVAEHWGWKVGDRVPLNSNIFTNANTGNSTWEFTLVGTIPTAQGSSQTGAILIHYDYFNETITFGRDRIGWVPFLTTSAQVNNSVAQAIDGRFANSANETSTQDEKAFNESFAAQRGNIALVISLVVGAAFAAILLIVGTTMTLAVRERTKEIGVLKTLGFSSGRVLRMILGESLLLAVLGALLGILVAAGLLAGASAGTAQFGFKVGLEPTALAWSALIALAFGFVVGFAPAIGAYRLKIIDALSRR